MLSSELEFCLNQAFHQARSARHEFLTVEHLLLAILDAPKVREVLEGCGADLDVLAWKSLNVDRLGKNTSMVVQVPAS